MSIYNNTKHSLNQYLSNYDRGYKHRNAIRWLKNRDKELWNTIIKLTSFLTDPKPKQRCWHILNDIYERPTCPQTGEYTNWFEDRYLTFITMSAKTQYLHKQGTFNNAYTSEANAKRKSTFSKNQAEGKHKPIEERNFWTGNKMADAVKAGFQKKYGVNNAMDILEFRRKVGENQPNSTPRHLQPAKKLYYSAVNYYTELSWENYYNEITPAGLNRQLPYALDHIYSKQQGFRDNIPPYIIGHHSNLQILTRDANLVKSMRCDKTQEQLFEDYFIITTGQE